jgi:ferric-dicitrate binding protein FerR (iron transport regulator)
MMDRQQIEAYVNGDLDVSARERMEHEIAADAAISREVVEQLAMDQVLRVVQGGSAEDRRVVESVRAILEGSQSGIVQNGVMRQLRTEADGTHNPKKQPTRDTRKPFNRFARRTGRRSSSVAIWAAIAAMILIAAGVFMLKSGNAKPESLIIARFTTASSAVNIFSNGVTVPSHAISGGEIRNGDTLVVPAGGKATVQYEQNATAEKSFVDLFADTRASFREENGAKRIQLDLGTLQCDVMKQPEGNSMVLSTPHAEATVVGTRFILSATKGVTRLEVVDGHVSFHDRIQNKTLLVNSNQRAEAGPAAAPQIQKSVVEPEPAERKDAGAWTDLFNDRDLSGWTPVWGRWRVVDGLLVGDRPEAKAGDNFITYPRGQDQIRIKTEKEFGDFELSGEIRVENQEMAEIQIRNYATVFVLVASPRWRTFLVVAKGDRVTCSVDDGAGLQDVAGDQKQMDRRGDIAFYVPRKGVISLKNLRIREAR